MWALLLMVLNAPVGMQGWYYLNTYPTEKACLKDLSYVLKEMKKEYPADDLLMKCVPSKGTT